MSLENLPQDILKEIIQELDVKDFLNFLQVNRNIYNLSKIKLNFFKNMRFHSLRELYDLSLKKDSKIILSFIHFKFELIIKCKSFVIKNNLPLCLWFIENESSSSERRIHVLKFLECNSPTNLLCSYYSESPTYSYMSCFYLQMHEYESSLGYNSEKEDFLTVLGILDFFIKGWEKYFGTKTFNLEKINNKYKTIQDTKYTNVSCYKDFEKFFKQS